MKLAAVDIGSNATRWQVSNVVLGVEGAQFKRLEYLRFPLRLGHDVFKYQRIGIENEQRLIRLLEAFKILVELYEVDAYRICATSAFRDAQNKHEIVQRVQERLNTPIHIVGGAEEASLMYTAIRHLLHNATNHLHVDVGGGSTEVSLYTGVQKIASCSFNVGAMRKLERHDTVTARETMQAWIITQKQYFTSTPIGIATGGNIRKLAQLAKKRGIKKPLSLKKIATIRDYIAQHSVSERVNNLALNPDRADVILPAIEIYTMAFRCSGVEKLLVPDVSLRDGIIQALYEQMCNTDTQRLSPKTSSLAKITTKKQQR